MERGDLVTRLVDLAWPGHPTTFKSLRERLVPVFANLLRMATGGVLAYFLTKQLLPGPADLTGALTALLVMQASAAGSLKMGLVRVGAVLTGVGVALVISIWVGLSWWSLGALIFTSLLLAKVLRLTDQALEVPISGMLILGAGGQEIAAETRVLTTVIGAVVGMILPLLWPPAVPLPSAAAAVRRVAGGLSDSFTRAAVYLDENPLTREGAEAFLDDVQRVTGDIGRASEQIDKVSDIWRWNTRTLGRADVVPLLRSGLESLQRCAQTSRSLFYAVLAEAPDEGETDPMPRELHTVFSVVLNDLGSCIDSFGRLVEAEVAGRESEIEPLLQANSELLDETRAILTELLLDTHDRQRWLLRGSILRGVEAILESMDAERRRRLRATWRESQASLRLPSARTTSEVFLDRDTVMHLWRRQPAPSDDEALKAGLPIDLGTPAEHRVSPPGPGAGAS